MQVDLENPYERFLIQTYVDSILNAQSNAERNFDIHKLVHTYEVVQAAKDLVRLTPNLQDDMAQTIIDAALLHDLGRVRQFKNGRLIKSNHAHMGAALIEKAFPDASILIETTRYHSDSPSSKDPDDCLFVLNFVRDADMIANVRYNTENPSCFYDRIKDVFGNEAFPLAIDKELQDAVAEKRCIMNNQLDQKTFLNIMLGQLHWQFNLRTPAGFKLAHDENIFIGLRDVMVNDYVDKLHGTKDEKEHTKQQILSLYTDEFLTGYIKGCINEL